MKENLEYYSFMKFVKNKINLQIKTRAHQVQSELLKYNNEVFSLEKRIQELSCDSYFLKPTIGTDDH